MISNFNYLYDDLNLSDVNVFVNQLHCKYKFELKKYKNCNEKNLYSYNKDNFKKFITGYNDLVLKIIYEVLNFFPQLNQIPNIVFLHGSFSKGLNRYESDIDLNILYSNEYKDKMLPIEELIAVILYKTFNYSGRDKIHPIMLYTIKEINKQELYSTKDSLITFLNGEKLYYQCRVNYDETMYKIKNSSRNYSDFIDYVTNNIEVDRCEEWCCSFLVLKNNKLCYDLYETIRKEEDKFISKNSINIFNNMIDLFLDEVNAYFQMPIASTNRICDLNQEIKINKLGFFYKSIAILRRSLLYQNINVKNLNFIDIMKYQELKNVFSDFEREKIEENIFLYIWNLSRFEFLCKKRGINFSSRNLEEINLAEIEQQYYEIYHESFIEVYCYCTTKLYEIIVMILEKSKLNKEEMI